MLQFICLFIVYALGQMFVLAYALGHLFVYSICFMPFVCLYYMLWAICLFIVYA